MKKKEREYQKHLAEINIKKAKNTFLFLLTHFYAKFKLNMNINFVRSFASLSDRTFILPQIVCIEQPIKKSKIPTTVRSGYQNGSFINVHYVQYKMRTKQSRGSLWGLSTYSGHITRENDNKNNFLNILSYSNRLISEFNSNMNKVSSYSFVAKRQQIGMNLLNLQSTSTFKYLFFKNNNFILNYKKDTTDDFYFFDSETSSCKKIFSLTFTPDKTSIDIIKNPNLNIVKFNDVMQTFNKFIFNIAINF